MRINGKFETVRVRFPRTERTVGRDLIGGTDVPLAFIFDDACRRLDRHAVAARHVHRQATVIAGRLALTMAIVAFAGPTTARTGPTPDLLVSVHNGAVSAPDTIGPGWTRVRVEEDGAGHIIVVFRVPDAMTAADLKAFIAALDTGRATPKPAVAMGGPEIGDTGEVVVQLPVGRYVLACVRQSADGRRHASAGEVKILIVSKTMAASRRDGPRATEQIRTVDFAYVGSERWHAGSHMLRIENAGRQDHQLRILRLRAGSTLRDWVNAPAPGRHGVPVAGMARMSPGSVAYLPVDLERGTYVLHCLVADTATGRPHALLGMFRSIEVE